MMSNGMPPEIEALVKQINRELDEVERQSNEGIKIVQELLTRFRDSAFFISHLALFQNYLFFAQLSRQQVANLTQEGIVQQQEIQNQGEYLSTLLGKIFDAKIAVQRAKTRLENLG